MVSISTDAQPYPDLRDFQTYLGELLERNEERRHRYLGWLGSSLTAIALLAWLLMDILERSPESQTIAVGLVLLSLAFFMLDFVDSVLKGGLGGLFSKVTAPWVRDRVRDRVEATEAERKGQLTFIAANLDAIRQRSVLVTVRDVLLNSPPLLVFLATYMVQSVPALVALGIWIVRVIIAGATLAGFLVIASGEVVELMQKSPQGTQMPAKGLMNALFFLMYRFSRATAGIVLGAKVVYYSVLVFAGYWLLTQYGSPPWIALRLTIIAFAIGVLVRFASNAWIQVNFLGEENREWGAIRYDILVRKLETPEAVEEEMSKRAQSLQEKRLLPFKLPNR
jgi:hypothetical protein